MAADFGPVGGEVDGMMTVAVEEDEETGGSVLVPVRRIAGRPVTPPLPPAPKIYSDIARLYDKDSTREFGVPPPWMGKSVDEKKGQQKKGVRNKLWTEEVVVVDDKEEEEEDEQEAVLEGLMKESSSRWSREVGELRREARRLNR